MKQNLSRILCLFLAIQIVLPSGLLLAGARPRRTVMIVTDPKQPTSTPLTKSITRGLERDFLVLGPDVSWQIFSTYLDGADDGVLGSHISEMDRILNRYYSFRSNADQTLLDLEKFQVSISSLKCVTRKCSDLFLSAIMTSSWLHFEKRQKDRAKDVFERLFVIREKKDLHLEYYPSAFRRYVEGLLKERGSQSQRLSIDSEPSGAAVYVNRIHAGETPLSLDLPAGSHDVSVKSPGRVPVSRRIRLKAGTVERYRPRLRWDSRQKRMLDLTKDWQGLSLAKKSVLAEKLAESARSDFVVFVSGEPGQAVVDVYNARYSQFYKSITDDTHLMAQLKLYVNDDHPALWSSHVDKKLVSNLGVSKRRKKPLYFKPVFWAVVGGVAAAAVTGGILAQQRGGSGSGSGTGEVVIDLGGF